jgi:tetratricopeptide (TPR) repeat protein
MSIIHDALKKAEREREPPPRGLPLSRALQTARRRWHGGVTAGMLIGATTVGAVSAWLWLQGWGGGLTLGPTLPIPQSSPAMRLEGEEQAAWWAAVAAPPPVAQPLEVLPRSQSDDIPSSASPQPLVLATPATAEAAFEKARVAESKGQWEQAKQHYRQALALNPGFVEAHNNLGNLYIRQQQSAAAIGEFQAALALDPHYAIARNNLGSAYVTLGEEALAIQEFLAALHIDGAYVSPYYNLASLYARRGDIEQSVAFLTKALAIEPMVFSWLQEDPDFDRIRAAPELERLRTPGYARR